MDEVGEFTFQVNETCLHNDSNMFLLYPNDKDSHNPFLLHLTPLDVTHNEARQFIPPETKMKRKQTRKEIQRTNRRKKYDNTWEEEEEEQDDEGPWLNRESWRNYTGNPYWTSTGRQWEEWTQRDDNTDWWNQRRQHQRSGKFAVKVPNNLVVVEKVVVVAHHLAHLRYGDLEDKSFPQDGCYEPSPWPPGYVRNGSVWSCAEGYVGTPIETCMPMEPCGQPTQLTGCQATLGFNLLGYHMSHMIVCRYEAIGCSGLMGGQACEIRCKAPAEGETVLATCPEENVDPEQDLIYSLPS
eukprot:s194_g46.t1